MAGGFPGKTVLQDTLSAEVVALDSMYCALLCSPVQDSFSPVLSLWRTAHGIIHEFILSNGFSLPLLESGLQSLESIAWELENILIQTLFKEKCKTTLKIN